MPENNTNLDMCGIKSSSKYSSIIDLKIHFVCACLNV